MSTYDDFIERLEFVLQHPEAREAFEDFVGKFTPDERAALLAEAEQRDPTGALEWSRGVFDMFEPEVDKNPESESVN